MEWIFYINPRIVISIASALACLYFLCICAEEIQVLLAYWKTTGLSAEPLTIHKRVKFPRFPRDTIHTTAPGLYFVPEDAQLAPSRL
ncbi:hypothetical protein SAMN02746095_00717 [Acidocella aminolytica 101 = DSM 11237]|nr:hypothetical protein SAMN02746095_00717 [Acidocella aminolytica 101 = DSM 11237]